MGFLLVEFGEHFPISGEVLTIHLLLRSVEGT